MYRMILPETLPDVAAAEAHAAAEPGGSVDVPTVDVRAVDADAAAARTRADYGRVSRWALGLLGTAGAAVAVLIAVFPLSLVGTAGTGQVLFGAVFVAIALAIAVVIAHGDAAPDGTMRGLLTGDQLAASPTREVILFGRVSGALTVGHPE